MWFGPPRCFTTASTCSWIGRPVSGLHHATYIALLRLGFPSATRIHPLNLAAQRNSLARSTKSTQSRVIIALLLLVSTRFQVLFHSPPGVLFTFPSRYYFSIGHQVIFRLGRWSSRLPTGFLVSRGTLELTMSYLVCLRGFYALWPHFPVQFSFQTRIIYVSPQPRPSEDSRFGLFPVRSPLLGKSLLLSFPPPT